MVLIVISGYLISTADNSSISVFDLFLVPATITSIPEQEDMAGLVHEYLSYSIIGLTILHVAAALKHHFIDKDNTLRKMLGIH
jgi:cytochrome b561